MSCEKLFLWMMFSLIIIMFLLGAFVPNEAERNNRKCLAMATTVEQYSVCMKIYEEQGNGRR